jgi:hypothetical protein
VIARFFALGHGCGLADRVPIIFRSDYLEWIDPEPAPDESDLEVTFKTREDDVCTDLRLVTDGFTWAAPRARIVRGEDLVDIHPLP